MQAKKSKSTKPRTKPTTKRPARRGGDSNPDDLGIVQNEESCSKMPRSITKVRCIEVALQRRIELMLKKFPDDTDIQEKLKEFFAKCSDIIDEIDRKDDEVVKQSIGTNGTSGTVKEEVVGGGEGEGYVLAMKNMWNSPNNSQGDDDKGKPPPPVKLEDLIKEDLEKSGQEGDLSKFNFTLTNEYLDGVRGKSKLICDAIDEYRKSKEFTVDKNDGLSKLSGYCNEVLNVIDLQKKNNQKKEGQEGGGKSKKRMTAYRRKILGHIRVLVLNKVLADMKKARKTQKALKSQKARK
jgi:hypothetical protein